MDGVELARKIRERDNHVMIAFLTAVGDHVFEGYEVQAVRYLMKPLQQEKLSELLELAAKAFQNNRKYLILEVSGEKEKIYLEDILAVESQGHYLNFHTIREIWNKKEPWQQWAKSWMTALCRATAAFCKPFTRGSDYKNRMQPG